MATTVGIRVQSSLMVHYCFLNSGNPVSTHDLIDLSRIVIPKALERPEQLNFVRNTMLDIFREYSPSNAFIKIAEYTGFGTTSEAVERSYFEGVIQEAVASSTIKKYKAGQISTLSALLSIDRDQYKKYVNIKANQQYPNLPQGVDWTALDENIREALICAHAAFYL